MTLTARPGWRPHWAGLAWALWILTLLGLAATAWLDHLLRQGGRPDLGQRTGAGGVILLMAATSAATSGAILASRRPRHPVGWLLLAVGLGGQAVPSAGGGCGP